MYTIQSNQQLQEQGLQLVESLATFEHAYSRWVEAPLQDSELTYARIRLLGVLSRKGPQIMSVLSDELVVSPRNVTVLVDALEGNGLVRRRPHPTDRRAILVELTQQGAATGAAMYRQHAAAVADLFSDLSEGDQQEFLRLLQLLYAGLRRRGVIDEYPGNEG